MPKIGLLSDTHGSLPEAVNTFFAGCDEIWHAGDIGNLSVLKELSAIASVRAVYGNIDGHDVRSVARDHTFFVSGGKRVLMKHIGGRPGAYTPETREQIAKLKPDIFVCGHSHILLIQFNKKYNLLHLNPGAAGNNGFHKMITMLRFEINDGNIVNMEIWEKPRKTII
ncbi:hypothetical protein SDC9_44234 [bioreactor metagenome]|uniref:Calcineurin-like phosphoesterase domain-containing protein n=1 Tax=bioreactor metagenome TaxID=1076179 RepID=A0A644W3D6_9ZZZZ